MPATPFPEEIPENYPEPWEVTYIDHHDGAMKFVTVEATGGEDAWQTAKLLVGPDAEFYEAVPA